MKKKSRGISLLEVLIAMGLLLGSLAVLSQLAFLGRKHLDRAEEITTAARLCNNKLGEVLAGIEPLEKIEDEPFESDPNWKYSIEIRPLEQLDLVEVRVRVYHSPENTQKSTGPHGRFTLVRWVHRELGPGASSVTSLVQPPNESSSSVLGTR